MDASTPPNASPTSSPPETPCKSSAARRRSRPIGPKKRNSLLVPDAFDSSSPAQHRQPQADNDTVHEAKGDEYQDAQSSPDEAIRCDSTMQAINCTIKTNDYAPKTPYHPHPHTAKVIAPAVSPPAPSSERHDSPPSPMGVPSATTFQAQNDPTCSPTTTMTRPNSLVQVQTTRKQNLPMNKEADAQSTRRGNVVVLESDGKSARNRRPPSSFLRQLFGCFRG